MNAATIGSMPTGAVDERTAAELSPLERDRLARIETFMSDGNGDDVIRATRPQTVGYGLEDSPAAMTRTATSAADKLYTGYGELFADPASAFADSGVSTAVVAYAEDVSIRRYAEQGNTIVRWSDVGHGGHVAALEQPASLVADLREPVAGLD